MSYHARVSGVIFPTPGPVIKELPLSKVGPPIKKVYELTGVLKAKAVMIPPFLNVSALSKVK